MSTERELTLEICKIISCADVPREYTTYLGYVLNLGNGVSMSIHSSSVLVVYSHGEVFIRGESNIRAIEESLHYRSETLLREGRTRMIKALRGENV